MPLPNTLSAPDPDYVTSLTSSLPRSILTNGDNGSDGDTEEAEEEREERILVPILVVHLQRTGDGSALTRIPRSSKSD